MAKQQKLEIEIDRAFNGVERQAIAQDIIDFIVERTRTQNLDKSNRAFPGYSKEYKESFDFMVAGKSSSVDLTLSGDMLDSLEILSSREGKVVIGFAAGTEENAKAEGNIIGSYGKPSGNPSKARDFLGIHPEDLSSILAEYRPTTPLLEIERKTIDNILERLSFVQGFKFARDSDEGN